MADDQDQLIGSAGGVRSPCIGVCELNPTTDLCRGCWRSGGEIATWRDASDLLRLGILERVRTRRERLRQAVELASR